jgi:uncharacterized membrane protein YkvA (DUF1232 family)
MTETKLYSEMLNEIFSQYKGQHKELLRNIPLYFNLLQKMYSSDELTWEAKFKINSCFSYFAIPMDLIPDETPEGYLDDLFVCAHVLQELLPDYAHIIKGYGGDLSEVKDLLTKVENLLGEKRFEILAFTGLTKFNEMSQRMAFLKAPDKIDEKTERIKDEILSLIGLLRTIFIVESKKPKGCYLRHIKELFSDEEWNEVIHILERLEVHESSFDDTHEVELEKIKRKVMLDVDEGLLENYNGKT